jgi:hypothetical protein
MAQGPNNLTFELNQAQQKAQIQPRRCTDSQVHQESGTA